MDGTFSGPDRRTRDHTPDSLTPEAIAKAQPADLLIGDVTIALHAIEDEIAFLECRISGTGIAALPTQLHASFKVRRDALKRAHAFFARLARQGGVQ